MGDIRLKPRKSYAGPSAVPIPLSDAVPKPELEVSGRASCDSCQNGRALALPRTITRLGATLALALTTALFANYGTASAWFLSPQPAGTSGAESANTLYWIVLVIGIVAAVAINVAILRGVRRYRARRGSEPQRDTGEGGPRQLQVAGALTALAVVIFALGVIFTEKSTEVKAAGGDSADTVRIKATGQQWLWRYDYPDEAYSYFRLTVPVNTEIVLDVGSTDVVHSWNVPGLAGKVDAVPGKHNQIRFVAENEGLYKGSSAVLSGQAYAAMRTEVAVVSADEYKSFVQQQLADTQAAQEAAAKSYQERQGEE